MGDSIADISGKLAEVVDKYNRAICLMPVGEILRQGLLHRSVGVILRTREGQMLFLREKENFYGVSAFGIPPGGVAAEDFGVYLLNNTWGLVDPHLRRLGALEPDPATGNSFASLFECPISFPMARELSNNDTILADHTELSAMAKRPGMVSPLLKMLLGKKLIHRGKY